MYCTHSHSHSPLFLLSYKKSFQAQSQQDAHAILTQGVATIQSWKTLYQEHFGKDITAITEEYSMDTLLPANPSLLASLQVVRNALHQEVAALHSLETYIHLLMPQMEDGM